MYTSYVYLLTRSTLTAICHTLRATTAYVMGMKFEFLQIMHIREGSLQFKNYATFSGSFQ